MNMRMLVAGVFALAITGTVANALTIVNKDNVPYTLKIIPKGGTESDTAIKAASKAQVDCKETCQITLGAKTEEVDGTAQSLAEQADELRRQIGQFKLEGEVAAGTVEAPDAIEPLRHAA